MGGHTLLNVICGIAIGHTRTPMVLCICSMNSTHTHTHTHTHTQKCLASNESSGIDIVVQIILTELTALDESKEKAMELKNNASKTLLAVMESHQDSDIIERIMLKIGNPELLVSV